MQMVLLVLGIIVWLLFLALIHMISRYKYTAKSIAVLAIIAAPCFYFGNRLALHWFPGLVGSGVFYVISVPAGIGIWIGMSFAVVMAWRQVKLEAYDKALRSLRNEEATLLEEARQLNARRPWTSFGREAPEEEPSGEDRDEMSSLERIVDEWQREPGKERVRSVKVQAWRDEIAFLDKETLKRRIQELVNQKTDLEESLRKAHDTSRHEAPASGFREESFSDMAERVKQLEVQLALCDLRLSEIRRGENKEKTKPTQGKPGRYGEGKDDVKNEDASRRKQAGPDFGVGQEEKEEFSNLTAREAEVRERLELVRREIDVWEKRRSEFLEKRITLD
ncbi:MAG TPA: hypothetical protein GX507_08330 [Clostridia bacterium]|nr:hypothetical protein [Clostridia bacterium]